MIEGLKPYAEYRDSGVLWLGRVPIRWSVARIKTVLHETDCRSTDGRPTLLSLTRIRGLLPQAEASKRMHGAKTLVGFKVYRPGQIVMNRMQAWSGMFGACNQEGLVSPDYAVFRVIAGHDVRFLVHRLKAPDLVGQFAIDSRGIGSGFNRLYSDRFGAIPVSVPPPEEQVAIMRFLEHANRRLEKAIASKRRLIELLKEQKQVIIHRAVTGGLKSNARLRPSGIPWLGDIPEHWDVLPLVRCVIERADYRGATPEKVEAGVFLVTAKNIRQGRIDYESSREYVRVDQYSRIMRRGLPKRGDVLLTTEAPLGHVALVDREDIALAQRIIRFRLDPSRLRSDFALYSLTSRYFQDQLQMRATGSTAQGIKASKLPQLLLVFPSTDEQERILNWLRPALGPLDTSILQAQREIDLIREYHTRLIADVVTGQFDVREAARHLPAETEQPEAVLEGEAEEDTELVPENADE